MRHDAKSKISRDVKIPYFSTMDDAAGHGTYQQGEFRFLVVQGALLPLFRIDFARDWPPEAGLENARFLMAQFIFLRLLEY